MRWLWTDNNRRELKGMPKQMRTVRPKAKGAATKATHRTLEELLGVNVDVEVLAENLTDEETLRIIDRAGNLNQEIKAMEPELKRAKVLLMATAKKKGWKTMAASTTLCKIKPKTSTEVDAIGLLRKIRDLKKKHLFAEVFKAQLTKAKEYLGEDELKSISEKKTKAYGSVNLIDM